MSKFDYYDTPPDEIFEDIHENAVKIWQTYDDTHGYASEKIARIDIKNMSDNAWYIVAMFDQSNQAKLLSMVKPETADMIRKARGY